MNSIKTVIVDDEPHARRYLADLLASESAIEVMATLKNGREALTYVNNYSVDLIFLDIHMPGINGLEVMGGLPKDNPPLIIFTTAYDQYAIKAFEKSALDYLLKPFDNQRLKTSINKAQQSISLRERLLLHEKIIALYQDFEDAKSPTLTEFIIKERGLEKIIKCKDIHWITSNSVYAELHLKDGKSLYRCALSSIENELPDSFLRIHRSIIVNRQHVERVSYMNNNTYKFFMKAETALISSRSYKKEIMNNLSSK